MAVSSQSRAMSCSPMPGIHDSDLKRAVTNVGVHGDQLAKHRARLFSLAEASEQVAKRRQRAALFARHGSGGAIGSQRLGELTVALVSSPQDNIGAPVIRFEPDREIGSRDSRVRSGRGPVPVRPACWREPADPAEGRGPCAVRSRPRSSGPSGGAGLQIRPPRKPIADPEPARAGRRFRLQPNSSASDIRVRPRIAYPAADFESRATARRAAASARLSS